MEYAAFNVDADGNPIDQYLPIPPQVWRVLFSTYIAPIHVPYLPFH
jgi:hypothetical protein